MTVKFKFSEEAEAILNFIKKRAISCKGERIMLRAISRKLDLIKQNPRYGRHISTNLIPKEYIIRYNAKNLYRVELPQFWRMLYTLTDNGEIEIIAFVLDIIDHKKYDKKFGYKD